MKIFFSHSKNLDPYSKIIQWATKGQWTHCGFILDSKLGGETMTGESVWDRGGATIGFWASHQWSAYEIYEFESSESEQMTFLKSMDGLKYSYAKVFLLGVELIFGTGVREKLRALLKKTGIWNDPWTDGLWCSEYCNAYFQLNTMVGELVGLKKDTELVWPEDVYQSIKSNPKFRLINSN